MMSLLPFRRASFAILRAITPRCYARCHYRHAFAASPLIFDIDIFFAILFAFAPMLISCRCFSLRFRFRR